MESREPETIADYACHTGENPLWHPGERRLYWVDIPDGRLFSYDPATGRHRPCSAGRPVGGFTIQQDGALLLFMDRGTVATWRDGAFERTIRAEIPAERETRFNDVIADPAGRVFCGTMPTSERAGRLYRLDPDASLRVVVEDVGLSNGMGFTPDGAGFYHTDTAAGAITRYDYDAATGEITRPRLFARVPDAAGEGRPDGMTVDQSGDVLSARWDGGCIVRYGPDGGVKERIAVPARKVSSVAFGGDGLRQLYVTTAGGHHKETEGALAGGLFRLQPAVGGVAEFLSRVVG